MNQVDFHDAGFRVFGLLGTHSHEGVELDEKEKYKVPISSNWQHTPHWSDEQFDTMHEMGVFDTGYGVLVYGYLVVDVDARNGGVESFSKLCEDTGIDLLAECNLAVATGSGNGSMHLYFKAPEGVSMVQTHNKYVGIDFKTSGFCVGAGSLHVSGATYEVMHGSPYDVSEAPNQLIEVLKRPEYHRTHHEGQPLDVSDNDIRSMLEYYRNDDLDYEEWVRVGMAIHDATDGTGYDIWLDWSATSNKHDDKLMEKRWHSFGKSSNVVTIGTIIHHAKENGWRSSYDDVAFETTLVDDSDILDTSSVDLKRPPGFVGEIVEWMNTQSFYLRENIAVASAIAAVGNAGGLRYIDELNNFTSNIYMLCVSASSTGKENIQQCYSTCIAEAGHAAALHGSIKSEQEMVRNLIRHQASYYVIDEFGLFLRKIVNAAGKSGATYLEGVIALAMSAYSKASSFLPVSGDLKEFIEIELKKEAAACNKVINAEEDSDGIAKQRLAQIENALKDIQRGIKNPFMSLIGFTTPVTFNSLVSFEMATNGFISRSMIFEEPETNPRPNKRYKAKPIPDHIGMRLKAIASGGEFESTASRVEFYGDKVRIPTTEDGKELLAAISESFWQMAEDAKDNGLEAIPRRGYELVGKISLALAIPEGLRTAEHIRWAYALAKSDIERKMRLAYSNMNEKDDPATAIAAKIQSILTSIEDPITHGVLINRCRPAKRQAVEKVLEELEKKNMVTRRKTKKSFEYELTRQ